MNPKVVIIGIIIIGFIIVLFYTQKSSCQRASTSSVNRVSSVGLSMNDTMSTTDTFSTTDDKLTQLANYIQFQGDKLIFDKGFSIPPATPLKIGNWSIVNPIGDAFDDLRFIRSLKSNDVPGSVDNLYVMPKGDIAKSL